MTKYNLGEMLAAKSEKQVIALIAKRIEKESGAAEIISKYEGDYRYEDSAKHQAMIKSAYKLQADCYDWLTSAFVNFSANLWDEMVISANGCTECFGYNELQDVS